MVMRASACGRVVLNARVKVVGACRRMGERRNDILGLVGVVVVERCGGEGCGRGDGDDAIRVLVFGRCVQMLRWMLDECGVCLG